MVNRYSSAGSFRYGFNGKEKDNEDYGEGNGYDYGARVYNSRLGKFLSVDPLQGKYPGLTPYQFASNRPIEGIDLDGFEFFKFNDSYIRMSVQYDSRLRQITNIETFYRAHEYRVGTIFLESILPGKLEEAIDQANTTKVATINLFYNSPLVKNMSQAEMKDIVNLPSSMNTQTNGLRIIDRSSQALKEMETDAFASRGASSGVARANAIVAAIELTGSILEQIGIKHINGIIRSAQGSQSSKAADVAVIIQNEIIKGPKGILPGKYLNQASLSGLANYLLYGEEIKKLGVVNGSPEYVQDIELTDIAKTLWDKYSKAQKQTSDSKLKQREFKKPIVGSAEDNK